jgi:transcriptional regulator with XRE-family HTH domain
MPAKPLPSARRLRDLRSLGERLAARRRQVGLSQVELAKAAGLSKEYVSLIERGGRNPPYTTLLAIARALRLPLGLLVPE